MPTRPPPIPAGQQQVEDSLQMKNTGKTENIPNTPSKPILSPRRQLDSNNFHVKLNKKSDHYYEKMILQEMVQRSYIKFHPTTGYHRATEEIQRFYDGFEIYNFNDKANPRRPVEDSDYAPTTMQQLLAISYYAPTFFDTMKLQKLDNLRRLEWSEVQRESTTGRKDHGALRHSTRESTRRVVRTRTTTSFLHRERHRREALLVQLSQGGTVCHQRVHQSLPVQLPTGLPTVSSDSAHQLTNQDFFSQWTSRRLKDEVHIGIRERTWTYCERSGRENNQRTIIIGKYIDQDDIQTESQRSDLGQARLQATTFPRLLSDYDGHRL
eukprot:1894967-Amphidinium_carterae.2